MIFQGKGCYRLFAEALFNAVHLLLEREKSALTMRNAHVYDFCFIHGGISFASLRIVSWVSISALSPARQTNRAFSFSTLLLQIVSTYFWQGISRTTELALFEAPLYVESIPNVLFCVNGDSFMGRLFAKDTVKRTWIVPQGQAAPGCFFWL